MITKNALTKTELSTYRTKGEEPVSSDYGATADGFERRPIVPFYVSVGIYRQTLALEFELQRNRQKRPHNLQNAELPEGAKTCRRRGNGKDVEP